MSARRRGKKSPNPNRRMGKAFLLPLFVLIAAQFHNGVWVGAAAGEWQKIISFAGRTLNTGPLCKPGTGGE